jgi:hypothetical protein
MDTEPRREKLPERVAEVQGSGDRYTYVFKPSLSREDFNRNPKYSALVDASLKLLGNRGGFVLKVALSADGKHSSTFVDLQMHKSTDARRARAMLEILRKAGIANVQTTNEFYPDPRPPEFSPLETAAGQALLDRRGVEVVPTISVDGSDRLTKYGYRVLDATGNEVAFYDAHASEEEKEADPEKGFARHVQKIPTLKNVLSGMATMIQFGDHEDRYIREIVDYF